MQLGRSYSCISLLNVMGAQNYMYMKHTDFSVVSPKPSL